MATVEERLTILEQEMAKLPTKSQITLLSDLVTQYRNDIQSVADSQATAIKVLETRVADLLQRVTALENA